MDPVFVALAEKIRARLQLGELASVELDQLNECLELLERVSGDIQSYVDEFRHLNGTQFLMQIAKNKRNRDLEIVLTTLSANYFR